MHYFSSKICFLCLINWDFLSGKLAWMSVSFFRRRKKFIPRSLSSSIETFYLLRRQPKAKIVVNWRMLYNVSAIPFCQINERASNNLDFTLDLVPPVPFGALSGKRSPAYSISSMSPAPCHAMSTDCRSSMKVLHHVIFGLPCFRFPRPGVQSMAVRGSRFGGRRKTCPANLNRRSATISASGRVAVRRCTSSFDTRSR